MEKVPPIRSFWMVKGKGPSSAVHYSLEAAQAEAKRLAREAPGVVFVVLESVSAHFKVDVESVDVRPEIGDGIPF